MQWTNDAPRRQPFTMHASDPRFLRRPPSAEDAPAEQQDCSASKLAPGQFPHISRAAIAAIQWRKPRALDMFCGAGGATRGLQRAGFHVTGIDIRTQPRYCGEAFTQADALQPPVDLREFDFIWASPPCQRFSTLTIARGLCDRHPDHIEATRELLQSSGVHYCIENVPLAPLRRDLILTGEMFGLNTYRRRHFELSFFLLAPPPGSPFGPISRPGAETICGHPGGHSRRAAADGKYRPRGNIVKWRNVMGIEWMLGREIVEAVPPAYSEFIGRAAIAAIQSAPAADDSRALEQARPQIPPLRARLYISKRE